MHLALNLHVLQAKKIHCTSIPVYRFVAVKYGSLKKERKTML